MDTSNDRKLSSKVLITQAIGNFGIQCVLMLESYFLLFFYTDVIKIPALASTIIMAAARVWDAVNDPMMGVICDKTHAKEGKARFWIKYFSIPAGLCLTLAYICPIESTSGRIAWVAITYLFMGMAKTVAGTPANALLSTMTSNRMERVKLGQYRAVVGMFPTILIPALTMPLVRSFGGDDLQKGFVGVAILIGVVYGASNLLIYWGSEGYDPDTTQQTETASGRKSTTPSALKLLKTGLTNKYCLLVCLTYFLYLLMAGIMTSTLIYYFRYNLGNENLMATYSTLVAVGSISALVVMRICCKRFGNAMTCVIGGVICILAFLPRWITGDQIFSVFAVTIFLAGAGSGLVTDVIHQCILDAVTWGKLRTGTDNAGVIMSIYTFAQKFGTAISGVIAAGLLTIFHYEAGQEPSEAIQRLFFVENIIVPLGIAAMIVMLLLIIHRMEKQMVNELAAQTPDKK